MSPTKYKISAPSSSSGPGEDAKLFELAEQGKLKNKEILRGQVERMLADPKSKRLTRSDATPHLDADAASDATRRHRAKRACQLEAPVLHSLGTLLI